MKLSGSMAGVTAGLEVFELEDPCDRGFGAVAFAACGADCTAACGCRYFAGFSVCGGSV